MSDVWIFDKLEDTECFVAANDEVLMLVFRGTSTLADWATDLKLTQIPPPASWGVQGGIHKVSRRAERRDWHGATKPPA